MFRHFGSVRARVTGAAILVVALALALVGAFIVNATAKAMVSDAQQVAEAQARNLAIVVEADRITPVLDVDSAGATILQVTDEACEVIAASPQLSGA